jgi:SNF2 family DNA or RNA helicase
MIPSFLSVTIEGTAGRVAGKFSSTHYDLVREMPGRRKWKDGILFFEMTAQNILFVHQKFPKADFSLDFLQKVNELNQKKQFEDHVAHSRDKKISLDDAKKYPFKMAPMEHQFRGFEISKDTEYFGYFMEMGTGKSKLNIDKAFYNYSKGRIDTFVIIAPNGVHTQWIQEQLPAHAWPSSPYKGAVYRSGMTKSQKKEMVDVINSKDCLRVIAINVEALSHKSGFEFLKEFLQNCRAYVIVDESSRIKDMASKRTKNILSLRPLCAQRGILTGTPITQGVEDLYSQFMFLHPDILGFSSFYTFRNRYCHLVEMRGSGGQTFKKVTGYKNLQELQQKVDGNTFRVLKEECLDLPDKVYMNRFVELTDEQKKHYEEMRKYFITQIDNGELVDGPLAVTALIRLQQIVSGYLPSKEDPNGYLAIPSNRITSLIETINETSGKVIVWAKFIPEVKMIREALEKAEIDYVTYTGQTPQNEKEPNKQRFKTDPNCKVFLSNPQAGGLGLNLVEANNVIWYTLTYSLEEFLQAEARVHRIGQTRIVTYTNLLAVGTTDQKIVQALRRKEQVSTTVLDIRDLIE